MTKHSGLNEVIRKIDFSEPMKIIFPGEQHKHEHDPRNLPLPAGGLTLPH